uniref:non-specific serine/threonine protein kinase n=1 Tax=Octactis speculum TaxID=3111310 RepID=A0A7S2FE61_9STRA
MGAGKSKSSNQESGGKSKSRRSWRKTKIKSKIPATCISGFPGNIHSKYKVDKKIIGEGHYGEVRRCVNLKTRGEFALKTIKKVKVKRVEYLEREIQILVTVKHPNIIEVVDIFEDEKDLHIVTELCTGGELFDRIIEKTKKSQGNNVIHGFSERDAATLIRKTLHAIEYCHNEHDIVHRDLKPENFLFKTKDQDAEVKIIDFGLSRVLDDNSPYMKTKVGTPYYIAPEVLKRHYTKACDIWSIGVIAYILLCGYPPFYGDTDSDIFTKIMSCDFNFPAYEWNHVSAEAKDFIVMMLNIDYKRRPTATEALQHRWFNKADPMPLSTVVGPKLEAFVGMCKLKKVALQVIAENLKEDEIAKMREVFVSLDKKKTGVLTIDEMTAVADYPGLMRQLEDVMDGIDLDGSRTIDYNAFIAATMSRNVFIREEYVRLAFDHFDKDNSGYITKSNLASILGSRQEAQQIIGDVDIAGDGQISLAEFTAMMQKKTAINEASPNESNGGQVVRVLARPRTLASCKEEDES